jgi:hypothetical protein
MTQRRTFLAAGTTGVMAGVLAGALSQVASAQTLAPALPAEVGAELPGAQWTGSARLRFFGFDVYDSSLWVAPGFQAGNFAQHGLALGLTYLRALSGQAIAERSLKEMQRAGDVSPAQAQRWLNALLEVLPDVKAGDRITGLHSPGVGARFWHNGQARPAVRDPEFSRLFFGIWLSEGTSEPALRSALLSRLAP